jgi:hypothetical protein
MAANTFATTFPPQVEISDVALRIFPSVTWPPLDATFDTTMQHVF